MWLLYFSFWNCLIAIITYCDLLLWNVVDYSLFFFILKGSVRTVTMIVDLVIFYNFWNIFSFVDILQQTFIYTYILIIFIHQCRRFIGICISVMKLYVQFMSDQYSFRILLRESSSVFSVFRYSLYCKDVFKFNLLFIVSVDTLKIFSSLSNLECDSECPEILIDVIFHIKNMNSDLLLFFRQFWSSCY